MYFSRLQKLILSPGIFLVFGYFLGQGSYFALLIFLKEFSTEQYAGMVVLYFSLASLCFQFSDIGGNTVGLKKYIESGAKEAERFLRGRALLSIPVIGIACFIIASGGKYEFGLFDYFLFLLIGFTLSLLPIFYFDFKKRYNLVSILQFTPWILLSVAVLVIYKLSLPIQYVTIFIFILSTYLIFFTLKKSNLKINIKKLKLNDVKLSGIVIIPFVIGQLWGRGMLVILSATFGLAVLANFGIVRSIHGSLCAVMTRFMRPAISRFASGEGNKISNSVFILTMLVSVFIYNALDIELVKRIAGQDIGYWIPMIASVPIWVLGSYISSGYQVILETKYIYLESFSFLVHGIVFLALINFESVLAFFLSDLAKVIFVFFIGKNFFIPEKQT